MRTVFMNHFYGLNLKQQQQALEQDWFDNSIQESFLCFKPTIKIFLAARNVTDKDESIRVKIDHLLIFYTVVVNTFWYT